MVVLHEGEPGAEEFSRELTARGVPTELWRMRFDLDPSVPLRLLRRRPEIVHTHLVHADLLALPAAALPGCRCASARSMASTSSGSKAIAAADRIAARFAHRQIAISGGLARYLEATEGFRPGRFTVIRCGDRAGRGAPAAAGAARLAAIGRLIPIKGLDILLAAFAQARERLPEVDARAGRRRPARGRAARGRRGRV